MKRNGVLKKIIRAIKNPRLFIVYLGSKGYLKWLSDEKYLKILHRARMKDKLNLRNPKTFNEKLQWLKLYDRKKIYKVMTDKYKVRNYISSKIGEEYLIPLLGVWEKFEDIKFDSLPNKFVLKCTHDSGSTVICNKKKGINYKELNRFFNKRLNFDYYWASREWNYKGLKPRIIAEKYMVDESGTELKDYKIFTFNGEAKIIQVDSGRFTDNHIRNLYSMDWELLDVEIKLPSDPTLNIKKPPNLEKMLSIAERLAQGIPHVRVDLYLVNGSIYFGELTFHHAGGQEKIKPKSFELKMGEWLTLPNKI